jgi:hypothetical protein
MYSHGHTQSSSAAVAAYLQEDDGTQDLVEAVHVAVARSDLLCEQLQKHAHVPGKCASVLSFSVCCIERERKREREREYLGHFEAELRIL